MNQGNGVGKQRVLAFLVGVAATLLVIGALAWVVFGGVNGIQSIGKLNAVRRVIAANYVVDADWEQVSDAAADGMIRALDDRWSYYMTAQAYADYEQYSANTASGIGVTVSQRTEGGGFEILSVTDGSPASEAGLKPGQVIVRVADTDVLEMDMSELKALISAQTGDFDLTVLDEQSEPLLLRLHTDTFYTNPVSAELLDDGVGYIKIANFEAGACENTKRAIEQLREQGAQTLLLDVRSNPGGKLDELIPLLDYILPEGDVFVSVEKDGTQTVYSSDAACVQLPMAVLINADSYSAAEFFAAALREYDYAVVVGEPSTGKGRSQKTYVLPDGSAVHISTNRYLTPNRVDLSEQGGLVPDIVVENSTQEDAQLEAALKYLS